MQVVRQGCACLVIAAPRLRASVASSTRAASRKAACELVGEHGDHDDLHVDGRIAAHAEPQIDDAAQPAVARRRQFPVEVAVRRHTGGPSVDGGRRRRRSLPRPPRGRGRRSGGSRGRSTWRVGLVVRRCSGRRPVRERRRRIVGRHGLELPDDLGERREREGDRVVDRSSAAPSPRYRRCGRSGPTRYAMSRGGAHAMATGSSTATVDDVPTVVTTRQARACARVVDRPPPVMRRDQARPRASSTDRAARVVGTATARSTVSRPHRRASTICVATDGDADRARRRRSTGRRCTIRIGIEADVIAAAASADARITTRQLERLVVVGADLGDLLEQLGAAAGVQEVPARLAGDVGPEEVAALAERRRRRRAACRPCSSTAPRPPASTSIVS